MPRMLTSQLDTRCSSLPPTHAHLSEGCGVVHSCSMEGVWEARKPGEPMTTTTTTMTGFDNYVTTTPVMTRHIAFTVLILPYCPHLTWLALSTPKPPSLLLHIHYRLLHPCQCATTSTANAVMTTMTFFTSLTWSYHCPSSISFTATDAAPHPQLSRWMLPSLCY